MGAVAARRRLGAHLYHCVALPALLAGSMAHAQVAEPVRDPAVAGTVEQSTDQAETSLNAGQPIDSEGAANKDQSDIVVTGTLVRGIAPPGTNVIGVTQGDIQATGATTTAQLLQTIPQLGSFNDLQQPVAGGISVTVNRPNLRTLPGFDTSGGSTTLVLLDGHRIVGAGIVTTSPDPDIIPPGALQRLEIVPDGGSAIYGSDAVAGVLNFITLKKFSGLKVEGHYGLADDYHQADASATGGTDWGSGSAYVSYNYAEHGAIYGRDRDFIRQFPNQAPNVPTSGLLSIVCNPGNVQLGANSSTFYPLPFTTGMARAGAPNQCDTNDDQSYYPSEQRHSVFGGVSQELADGITLDARGFYTNRETTRNGGAYMATSTLSGATIDRYFPTQRIGTETQQVVSYQFGPIDARRQKVTLETWGVTPTLTADLGAGFQLRVLGSYSRSDTESRDPTFNQAALGRAINAGLFNPYNVAASDPAAYAVITNDETFARTRQRLANVRAILDGELFRLPGGGVKLAAGVEYSDETYRTRQADGVIPGQAAPGSASVSVGGVLLRDPRTAVPLISLKRDVKSAFGELVVPIFGADNATTLLREVTLSVSGRYDEYSDFGGTFNPKFGLSWRPVEWLKLRGSYGESFNAPSLADAPNAIPYTIFYVGSGANLPITALQQPDGPYPVPAAGQQSIIALRGNDPDIGPQTAKTLSLGFDVQPPFVEGLNLSATYFRIRLKGVIGLPPGANFTELYRNYGSSVTVNPSLQQVNDILALSPNPPFNFANGDCQPKPQCVYAIVNVTKQNLGDFNLSGLDFNGSYDMDTGFGSLNFGVNANYELTRKQSPTASQPFIDLLEANNNRFRLRASAGAVIGKLLAQAIFNHTGGFDLDPAVGFVPQTKVSAFNVVNLFFRYDFQGSGAMRDLQLTLNVDNVFDQDPPQFRGPQSGGAGTGIINGRTIGRLFQLGVSKKF